MILHFDEEILRKLLESGGEVEFEQPSREETEQTSRRFLEIGEATRVFSEPSCKENEPRLRRGMRLERGAFLLSFPPSL